MLTRPTTEQVLRGIVRDLDEQILPELQSETARVALGMITQLLLGCATRAAHEIAWMQSEGEAIARALDGVDDAETMAALADYRAADPGLDLDTVAARYHHAGAALGAGVEHAYRMGDQALIAALRELLEVRSAHEMEIVGALDLVGRG